MKIKMAENISARVARALNQLGHETDTVHQEGLVGQDDTRIWEAAQESGRFLITQDLDFSDIRRFVPGTHCGLLLVRLRSPGRAALMERIWTRRSKWKTGKAVLSWLRNISFVFGIPRDY